MRKILIVARQEFLANLRRPSFIITTLLVPALGTIALLIAAFAGGRVATFFERQFEGGPGRVAYVDHTGLFTPPLPAYTETYIPYEDEEAAKKAVLSGEVGACLVIPADYLDTGRLVGYTKEGGMSAAIAMSEERLRDFLVDHLLAGKVDEQLRQRAVHPTDLTLVALEQEEEGKALGKDPFSFFANFVLPYIFSVLLVISIFASSGFLLQGVGEEKEGRIIEILLSSLTPTELLAGKILGLGALGLAQVLFWLTSGWVLMHSAPALFPMSVEQASGLLAYLRPATLSLALAYFLLGYLLFATLMASAGSLGTSLRESQQLGGIFSFGAALPWMLSGFLMANPNSTLAVVLSLFPLTTPTMMLLRLGLTTPPAWEIVASLVLLVSGILGSLWAGSKVFRLGLLMYGKRPGLRQIWQALRQT